MVWRQGSGLFSKAGEVVLQRTPSREDDELELDEKWIKENRCK